MFTEPLPYLSHKIFSYSSLYDQIIEPIASCHYPCGLKPVGCLESRPKGEVLALTLKLMGRTAFLKMPFCNNFFKKHTWGPLALKYKNIISSNSVDFCRIFHFILLAKVLRFYTAILPYSVLWIPKCFLQVGKIWIIRSRRRNNL